MLLFAVSHTHAADATWGSSTTGNWSLGTNWTSSSAPGQLTSSGTTSPDTAFFNNVAGASLITLDSPWNIKNLTFSTGAGAYTIGTTGGNAFTLTSGGTISMALATLVTTTETINAPLVIGTAGGSSYSISNTSDSAFLRIGGSITSAGTSGSTTLSVTSNAGYPYARTIIGGAISDSGTGTTTAVSILNGSGITTLGGLNTYSGATIVQSTGVIANDGLNGNTGFSPNSAVTIANGATNQLGVGITADFVRPIGSGAGQIALTGNLAFSNVGTGNVVVSFGGLSTPQTITWGSGSTTLGGRNIWLNSFYMGAANVGLSGTIELRNPINLNGTVINIGSASNNTTTTLATISGVISGTATKIFMGGQSGSNIRFTGANTYDAPIIVAAQSTILVTSIGNWAPGNTTPSSLGAPTTQAHGLITLGSNSSGSGSLIYQGVGETSNRDIDIGWTPNTLDQQGTGLLKITGTVQANSTSLNQNYILILKGGLTAAGALNSGAGELSGNMTDDPNVAHNTKLTITKSGTNTWTLSGTNTYTGVTTITAGTLKFGKEVSLYNNGAAATWNSTNIAVSSGATLGLNVGGTGEFTTSDVSTLAALLPSGAFIGLDGSNGSGGSYSYNSVLSGPSGVGLNVLGNLTLTQNNTYTGTTNVSSGSLIVGTNAPSGSAGALGNASTAVTLGSANAEGAAAILTNGAFTVARDITEASSAANSLLSIGGSQTSGTSTYTGNVTLTKDTTLTSASGGEVDFTTGVISGAFNTVIDGGGIVKLTGTNTFGGSGKSVTVQGGATLDVMANTNLGNSSNSLIFNNGTMKFSSAFDPSTRTMTFNSGGATFDTNGNTVSFANSVGNGGSGGLTKAGSGSLILSAANSYGGTTNVTMGTLVVGNAGALGSGPVNISSGATLSSTVSSYGFSNNVVNNGTINSNGNNTTFTSGKILSGNGLLSGGGTYTVDGTLSPGNSPGTMTVDAFTALTLDGGATTIWQLNAEVDNSNGTAGVGGNWDTLVMNANATINLSGTLQIALDGISFSSDPYWESNHAYALFGGAGLGDQSGSFSGYSGSYTYTNLDGTGTFAYSAGSNDITYTWVAVPEPQTWALAALGISAVLFRLRQNNGAKVLPPI